MKLRGFLKLIGLVQVTPAALVKESDCKFPVQQKEELDSIDNFIEDIEELNFVDNIIETVLMYRKKGNEISHIFVNKKGWNLFESWAKKSPYYTGLSGGLLGIPVWVSPIYPDEDRPRGHVSVVNPIFMGGDVQWDGIGFAFPRD